MLIETKNCLHWHLEKICLHTVWGMSWSCCRCSLSWRVFLIFQIQTNHRQKLSSGMKPRSNAPRLSVSLYSLLSSLMTQIGFDFLSEQVWLEIPISNYLQIGTALDNCWANAVEDCEIKKLKYEQDIDWWGWRAFWPVNYPTILVNVPGSPFWFFSILMQVINLTQISSRICLVWYGHQHVPGFHFSR